MTFWNSILAIDPGPKGSGFAIFLDGVLVKSGKKENNELRHSMNSLYWGEKIAGLDLFRPTAIAIEGMKVPRADRHVFETCYEIGRFIEIGEARLGAEMNMVFRHEVKKHWLGTVKGGDKEIRDAIVKHYGGYDRVKTQKGALNPFKLVPPPALAGVTGDAWSAVAIGLYAYRKFALS